MANIYYKLDDNDNSICYYCNEQKEGYVERPLGFYQPLNAVTKEYILELTNGVFEFREDSSHLFEGSKNVTFNDTDKWDFSAVTNADYLFYDCQKLTSIDASTWDTSNLTSAMFMFGSCYELLSLDLSNWDTSSITTMKGMFQNCRLMESLNLNGWDTSNVTSMQSMFYNCYTIQSLEGTGIKYFDVSNVEDMSMMFRECDALQKVDLSLWEAPKLMTCVGIFSSCDAIREVYLGALNPNNQSSNCNFTEAFAYSYNLTMVDLSGYQDLRGGTYTSMFSGCRNLVNVYVPAGSDWSLKSSQGNNMFANCTHIYNWSGGTGIWMANNTKENGYFGTERPATWTLFEVWIKENGVWYPTEVYK